jgi:four helix bundle protein
MAKARLLTKAIYQVTRGDQFSRDRALVDQIRRAAISIMSNIAEGLNAAIEVNSISS